ncbi:hypothetical protein Poli38472_010586 [Pythium oligandrum]|uniref:F-box/LRR-repeat protein 15-like leucin rich repeat domain-containing protein n=1 Tax=Pythium oligandrum TaxID=41045 RepID=A0A8K1C3B0_PYTOL|nr:hypothetical protein Poli38472_010586 [Pythium oligandrum]|eukprot:TMW55704.1 hypothetical protein Poli38472_010586 [Pythium oligandrum]
MWRVADQETAKDARAAQIQRENERYGAARCPIDFSERMTRATRHCTTDCKVLSAPPRELYFQDCIGAVVAETIDLENLPVTNEWMTVIVNETNETVAKREKKGRVAQQVKRLVLAGTLVSDPGFYAVHRLKQLIVLDISRCSSLTDASLNVIRRFLTLLQELNVSECRHFTSTTLSQTWKDCYRLHTLVAKASPAVTDAFLQSIATTTRTKPEYTLRRLDIRRCKSVTSSGISYLASSSLRDMNVTSLCLADCMDVDNMAFFAFESSVVLKHLVTLDLAGLRIDETGISWIAKGCVVIEHLNFARCGTLSDYALSLLSSIACTRLKSLSLKQCTKISDQGIKNLFGEETKKREEITANGGDEDDLPGLPLEVLNLKDCQLIGDFSVTLIGRCCPRLKKINLKELRKVSDTGILRLGKGCPHLESIKLSGRYITDQTFKVFGKICPKLHQLDICERLDLQTPECFLSLTSGATAASLLKLNFCSTNICDAGVSMIAVSCPNLQYINLSKCQRVTDVAVEALAWCCHRLQALIFSGTKAITDRGIIACAMMRLPLLVVDLCGNTNISDGGLQALCTTCQHIQELRLKGCDRLSPKVIRACNASLPFTKTQLSPSLQQRLAVGGGNATAILTPLSHRHIQLLRTLVTQYEKACILQARVRHWKEKEASIRYLARRRMLRQTRAARKIQKCARSFLSWRRHLRKLRLPENTKKVVMMQAHIRGNQSRHRTRVLRFTMTRAAKRIQRGYRPHYAVRMPIRIANIVTIQRIYRGYCGRQRYKRILYEKKCACALRIWHWYRRCVNQRDLQRRSHWLMQKIRSIQDQWRKYCRRRNFTKYLGYFRSHATRIQTIWRGVSTRKYVAQLRIDMTRSAIVIQRVYRGHIGRQFMKKYSQAAHTGARSIQKRWRGYAQRQKYLRQRYLLIKMQRMARYASLVRVFREIVRAAVAKHRKEAAVCIQRHARGMLGRRRALLFRKIRNAKYAQKGQNASQALIRRRFIQKGAAVRIQQWIRRVQARRKMLMMKRWRQYIASRCLQRYLKAWMRRVRVKRKRDEQSLASGTIQRVYRGHLGRVTFKAEKHRQDCLRSAKLIQRVYRGFRARCFYAIEKRDMTRAARMLQRAYRSRQASKFYEISQATAALKAKEKYEKSFLRMLDSKRNPMDELYRRAKLPREKDMLVKLKDKWEANRVIEERAVRKLRREEQQVWKDASETIGNHLNVRTKLYGVTENVYVSHREYVERQERQVNLKSELVDLHKRIAMFKQALRSAVASQRILDGNDVFNLLKAHDLFVEASVSNQDDD